MLPLPSPKRIRCIDGSIAAAQVTHFVRHKLTIGNHVEQLDSYVAKIDRDDFLLGIPWLRKHNPLIDWVLNTLCFRSEKCRKDCLKAGVYQDVVHGTSPKETIIGCLSREETSRQIHLQTTMTTASKPRLVGAAAFKMLSENHDVSIFSCSFQEVENRIHHLENNTTDNSTDMDICLAGASILDIEKALETKPHIDPATLLPPRYHRHLKVFDVTEADKLPPHREGVDHKIILKEGAVAPSGRLYGMSLDELRD